MERVFREQSSPKKHVPKNRHRAENAQNIDWNSKTQLVFSEISPRCRFFGTRFWCDFGASFERFLTGVGHLDRRASGAHFADRQTDRQTDGHTLTPILEGLNGQSHPGSSHLMVPTILPSHLSAFSDRVRTHFAARLDLGTPKIFGARLNSTPLCGRADRPC